MTLTDSKLSVTMASIVNVDGPNCKRKHTIAALDLWSEEMLHRL